MTRVICDYCGNPAKLIESREVYGWDYGKLWACTACQAYVGCHKNSKDHKPLGRLANSELRAAKQMAHRAFDPLWKGKIRRDGCSKSKARDAGYKWLAGQMGIAVKDCHIGMFDVEQCNMVVDIVNKTMERNHDRTGTADR